MISTKSTNPMAAPHGFAQIRARVLGGLALVVLLVGCATGPDANPRDPLEPFNRSVTSFNDAVDDAVVKPVATAYRDVTPDPFQTGVRNFFGNLGDVWSFVNATLQLRPKEASESFLRVAVNSVFGVLGLVDIATEMGIDRSKLDLGHTLGRWGVPSGPYLVLPIFGPSSIRDATGFVLESRVDLVQGISDVPVRNSLYTLRAVDTRANLLRATSLLEGAALDKYSFVRDIYLQRRDNQIEDIREQGFGLNDGR